MRRKRQNKGDILVDLTSLLDIIFIILLIVICNQWNETSEAEKVTEQAETQLQLYTDQMDTVDSFCIASLNARYEQGNVKKRHICIKKNGEDPIEEFDMIGNNTEEPLNKLKESLKKYIVSNEEKPIILSLNENDENILYRDERAILNIFDELKDEYKNVYLK